MREANETCYAAVRAELQALFGALCRNKTADIVMAGAKVSVRLWCRLRRDIFPNRARSRVEMPRLLPPRASSVVMQDK